MYETINDSIKSKKTGPLYFNENQQRIMLLQRKNYTASSYWVLKNEHSHYKQYKEMYEQYEAYLNNGFKSILFIIYQLSCSKIPLLGRLLRKIRLFFIK